MDNRYRKYLIGDSSSTVKFRVVDYVAFDGDEFVNTNLLPTYLWQFHIIYKVNDISRVRFLFGSRVNTINGLILLPDDWDGSVCPDFVYGFSSYLVNSFTAEQWKNMEEAGCVFLPSAGYRSGTAVSGVVGAVESLGYYWSSTINGSSNGYDVQVSTSVNPIGSIGRSIGHSVRLVLR